MACGLFLHLQSQTCLQISLPPSLCLSPWPPPSPLLLLQPPPHEGPVTIPDNPDSSPTSGSLLAPISQVPLAAEVTIFNESWASGRGHCWGPFPPARLFPASQWWSCPSTSPGGFAPPVSLSPPRPLGLTFSLSASQKTSFCWFDGSSSFQPVRNPHGIFLLEFRSGPQRCLSRPCFPVQNPSAWLPPDGAHPLSKAHSRGAGRIVQRPVSGALDGEGALLL